MPRPIFLLILNFQYKGFQMRYHLFKKFFEKVVKIKETSFLLSRCNISIAHHCKIVTSEGKGHLGNISWPRPTNLFLCALFYLGNFYLLRLDNFSLQFVQKIITTKYYHIHCKDFHHKNCRFSLCPFSHCSFIVVFTVIKCIQWITAVKLDCSSCLLFLQSKDCNFWSL